MTETTGPENFYDKVARKFGEYRTDAHYRTEYRTEDPEAIFRGKLLEMSGEGQNALDVGSGDGRFTLSVAGRFGQVVGIDTSTEMLEIARERQRAQGGSNVRFELRPAAATGLPDASFDVVYSRRGPTPYREIARLLTTGGALVHIGIGEQDALDLKRVFGRGQGFNRREISWLDRSRTFQEVAGLRVDYAEEFLYDEYYPTYADLETFLQGVPIFEDFDPIADRPLLQVYVDQANRSRGIRLLRHRFVTVARKP